MRNKIGNVLWGLAIIAVGVCLAGNAFFDWNFTLFFDGWWTLFIIIPCLITLFQQGFRWSAVIGLCIGAVLLLSAQNIVSWELLRKLIIPAIIILIGVRILFQNVFTKRPAVQSARDSDLAGVFSTQRHSVLNERFTGCNITSVFGGADLDLRNAIIDQDVTINVTAVFGGTDIYVPGNVKVKVSSIPLFGGVSNHTMPTDVVNAPTVYVNATCMFGGVDIK